VLKLAATNPEAAERFCDAVEQAIQRLGVYPEIGRLAGFPQAPRVRRWVLQPFPNYLLFYLPEDDGILLVRQLHGARRLPALIPPL
jgi:plasmid stabilization system protein ParE